MISCNLPNERRVRPHLQWQVVKFCHGCVNLRGGQLGELHPTLHSV